MAFPNIDWKNYKAEIALIILAITLLIAIVFIGTGSAVRLKEFKMAESATKGEQEDKPYYALLGNEPFTVNLQNETHTGFLQIEIQVQTTDAKAIQNLSSYAPELRNNIMLILSGADYIKIKDREGKEELRQQVLSEIQRVEIRRFGKARVTDVLFTSFTMQ